MAFSPITPWQIEGKKVEAVTDFIFLGSKITVDSDCSHEIKRCLLLGGKAIDKTKQDIKKQKHHYANKVSIVKAMVFPVVMYGFELDHKKTDHQRIDAFKLWYWRDS